MLNIQSYISLNILIKSKTYNINKLNVDVEIGMPIVRNVDEEIGMPIC